MGDAPTHGADRYRAWLEGLLGVPVTDGNQVDVLHNGDEIFAAMLEAIGAATFSVDLVTFVFKGSIGDEFGDALCERARAGVRVRVLLDAIGSGLSCRDVVARMREAGVRVELFRPILNPRVWETFHRAHRKVMVCDQAIAFTGGVGIADEWRGDARDPSEWRDTHFRVRGPAVDGLLGSFLHNWAEMGGPLFEDGVDRFPVQEPCGASPLQVVRAGARTGWGAMATLAWALLQLSQERVRMAAAYFVPDDHMLELLCATARRGVQVDLLVNGPNADKGISRVASEAQYTALLDGGIRVWSFQPTMLHLKTMLVDGLVASVGSANFNSRSFVLDEEVNTVIFDPDVVAVLDAHFDEDLARAQLIDPEEWAARGTGRKALEAVPGFVARHL